MRRKTIEFFRSRLNEPSAKRFDELMKCEKAALAYIAAMGGELFFSTSRAKKFSAFFKLEELKAEFEEYGEIISRNRPEFERREVSGFTRSDAALVNVMRVALRKRAALADQILKLSKEAEIDEH